METTFNYCLKNSVLGVGWRTPSNRHTKIWDEYFSEASKEHDNLNVCKYIQEWVSEGDLVWTRDAAGRYYLARAKSGWEYWISQEAIDKDIDVANVFRVDYKNVDIDAVPGKVVACFRAPKSIQEIADPKAYEYSKYLWNTLSGTSVYEVNRKDFSDIFMMLDDEETEDLVFIYLQSQGWYVIPNSRKGDSMSFEYLAVNPATGEKALTQVKTGHVPLNKDEYVGHSEKIFLFQSNELYTGTGAANIECITREALLRLLADSLDWLPQSFRTKAKLVSLS
jgi:hypothetical protein